MGDRRKKLPSYRDFLKVSFKSNNARERPSIIVVKYINVEVFLTYTTGGIPAGVLFS